MGHTIALFWIFWLTVEASESPCLFRRLLRSSRLFRPCLFTLVWSVFLCSEGFFSSSSSSAFLKHFLKRERERKKRSFLHYYTIITKVWLEKKITFEFYKGLRPPKPGMQSHQKGSQPPPNHLFWLPVPVQLADCRIYHCYTEIYEEIHFFSTQTKDAKDYVIGKITIEVWQNSSRSHWIWKMEFLPPNVLWSKKRSNFFFNTDSWKNSSISITYL